MNHTQSTFSCSLSASARRWVIEQWRKAFNQKQTTASQMAAYRLFLGKSLEPAFTPISRPAKLMAHQNKPYWAMEKALQDLAYLDKSALKPWATALIHLNGRSLWAYEGSWEAVIEAIETHSAYSKPLEA